MAQQAVDWQGIMARHEAQNAQQQAPAEPASPAQAMMQQLTQGDPQRLVQLASFLTQGANAQYSGAQAQLGQARDSQISELQKAYADAVASGEMSIREAEEAFKANKSNIERQAYNDAERTALMAEDRGIANSQQMMGMVAGDNARTNSLLSQNMTERDKRIADVKDRINALTKQKDLDIANANSTYNYSLANNRSQIASALTNQMFQMGYDDHNRRADQRFQLGQMDLQNQYAIDQMEKQFGFQEKMAGVQHGFDLEKMGLSQKYQLEQMAKAFGYDLDKMSVQQQYQLAQMAEQFGYNQQMAQIDYQNQLGLQNNQFGNQSQLSAQEFNQQMQARRQEIQMQKEAELQEYDLAVQRELAKYKPGTKEYEIRKGQLAAEREALVQETHTATMYDALAQSILGTVTEKPVAPKRSDFNKWYLPKSKEDKNYKEAMEDYNTKLKAYERYLNFQSDPMSAFP